MGLNSSGIYCFSLWLLVVLYDLGVANDDLFYYEPGHYVIRAEEIVSSKDVDIEAVDDEGVQVVCVTTP